MISATLGSRNTGASRRIAVRSMDWAGKVRVKRCSVVPYENATSCKAFGVSSMQSPPFDTYLVCTDTTSDTLVEHVDKGSA